MDININLQNNATSLEMDEVIFSQALTDINLHATETIANGVSCALLTANGKTLAHALVSDSKAVLDTNTIECVEYVASLPIEATRGAYLVIGESEKPLAIVPAQIAKNPIADIAPPTESAPVYPTHETLLAILAQMQETQRNVILAERNVGTLVNSFDATIADGVAQVNEASQQATNAIAQRVAEGETAIGDATSQGVTTIETASEGALSDIDTKVTEATTDINAKVTEAGIYATQATRSATQAQTSANSASRSATQAENAKIEAQHALNNGCFYTAESYGAYTEGETIQPQFVKETTAYAIDFGLDGAGALSCTIDVDMLYPLLRPQDVNINSCAVIWLWIRNWHSDPVEVTFKNNVAFVGSMPSFGARTEALFAIFGAQSLWNTNEISGIKHFIANLQFERSLDTGEPL